LDPCIYGVYGIDFIFAYAYDIDIYIYLQYSFSLMFDGFPARTGFYTAKVFNEAAVDEESQRLLREDELADIGVFDHDILSEATRIGSAI
jgi:hypothetical protein